LLPFSIAFPYFTFWHLENQAKYFAWDRLVVVLSRICCGLFLCYLESILQIYRTFSHSCVSCSKGLQNLQVAKGFRDGFQIWKSTFQAISSFYNFLFLFSATYLSVFSFLLSKICNLLFTFMFRFFILKFLNIIFS
jgi:hypothetical protein